MTIGRSPDAEIFLDDVTVSRNHALLVRRRDGLYIDDLGSLNGTYVNRRRIESHRLAGRRRAAGRQVQAHLPRAMTATDGPDARPPTAAAPRQKALTIGAVCKELEREFPDISISKIRYLEDQKLLAPRRTPGGYRLYTPGDVDAPAHDPAPAARRVPAAARDPPGAGRRAAPRTSGGPPDAPTARAAAPRDGAPCADRGALYALDDVLEETGAEPSLVKELEDYGVIKGEQRDGETFYDDTEREIIRAVTELARYGVGGRNLRVFRTSADREAALLEQILAPALRSRNPERRKEAVEALENLAAIASHLKHLLLIRDLRKLAR